MGSQDKIWEYFQNNAENIFSEAKPRLDFIIRQISSKNTIATPCILNIGAGSGYLEMVIQGRGWDVYSLDPDGKTIEKLIAKGIKGHKGRIEQMPFNNAIFDFVVASEVLEHLTDEQRCQGIHEIYRILKQGGWFIGTVPYCEDLFLNQAVCPRCGEVFNRWGHHKSFNIKRIYDELSLFFKVIEIKRTAFVEFRNRPFAGKIRSLIRLIMAKYGEKIATPSIYFCVRKY